MQTTVTASRQSSYSLADGDVLRIDHPDPSGMPSVWRWELANWGPGDLWVRWDGQLASVDDPASMVLPMGTAFQGIRASMITVAAKGQTKIALVVDNTTPGEGEEGFVPPRVQVKPEPSASDPKEPEPEKEPAKEPEPEKEPESAPEPEKEAAKEPERVGPPRARDEDHRRQQQQQQRGRR